MVKLICPVTAQPWLCCLLSKIYGLDMNTEDMSSVVGLNKKKKKKQKEEKSFVVLQKRIKKNK